ncbi:DUF3781 domain-containing protein [Anaerosphaera multitolerans]|uniref:DUF3781 domain-containing protein n=1 Tax=Anaerosphaera multitolerans TaxID=2487351 RepID=A0A437S8P8_9FIRM|nr:DUF3781 domain-containing protein [Anaerosphaera multitolerans]
MKCELIEDITKLHTTKLGVERIKRNLYLENENIVNWFIEQILKDEVEISRKGKNYYVTVNNAIITVNASSYTIITAHIIKR